MKRTLCFEHPVTGAWVIRLWQYGRDQFAVEFGSEITRNLSYGDAAKTLGKCIMHAMACEGKLDNSNKIRNRRL